MKQVDSKKLYAVCVKNKGYAASLELRKIYQVLPDDRATKHQMIRVIDESGEDYLYPAEFFVLIELPEAVKKAFIVAA